MLTMIMTVLPAWVIMRYVYKFDRYHPEPFSLMLKVFALGCLTPFLTVFLLLMIGFDSQENFHLALFGAAIPEEAMKFAVLYFIVWKHRHFDEHFDGIVYAVCVGLGFAVIENVFYVLEGGLSTALLRSVTAVPAHAAFAVFMGYFMALARFEPAARVRYLVLAYLVPVMMHFVYNYLAMSMSSEAENDNGVLALILGLTFLIFVITLYRQAHRRMQIHIERSA